MRAFLRYLPWLLAAGVSVVLWLFFRRKTPILAESKRELESIRAQNQAERIEAEIGRRQALEHVEAKYKAELEALDAGQKKEAETLRADPGKLSRFLVRAGRKDRTGG